MSRRDGLTPFLLLPSAAEAAPHRRFPASSGSCRWEASGGHRPHGSHLENERSRTPPDDWWDPYFPSHRRSDRL